MEGWILCRKNPDDSYTGIGIALSEAAAKGMVDDGDFLIVPITVGTVYQDIISAGLPGAVTYSVEGLSNQIAQARQAIVDLRSDIQDLQAELVAFKTQSINAVQNIQADISAIQTDVSGMNADIITIQGEITTINDGIAAIDARVTVLEST